MARKKIQGITIEIGGDTTKLQTALKDVENKLRDTQAALRDVNKLLKLDPGNVELLTQKQKLLNDSYEATEKKLETLEKAAAQMREQMEKGADVKDEYDTLQREIIDTKQQMEALTGQMKEFGSVTAQQMAAAGEKVKAIGDKISKAGTAMTKYVTGPIAAAGAASVAAFNEVDEGLDIIVKKTGATGEALEDLEERAKNLATSIPTDFKTAGEAVGEVNTRFGLTGQKLEDLSGKFIKFANLNDTSVSASIDSVQAAMAAFDVSAENAGDVLDILNKAGQDTGTSLDKLTGDLTANAAALREMGFDINTATGFLANLNKNGLDSGTVLAGMKKALQNATKQGKSMSQALDEMQQSIAGAKSETAAMQAASELFGAKAAPTLVKALREGRLSFDELANAVQGYGNSVDNTFEATLDPIDEFKTALNELKIVGMELVEAAAPLIKTLAEGLRNAIAGLRAAWEGLSPEMQQTVVKLAAVAAAVGPVLVVVGKLTTAVGSIMEFAPKILNALNAISPAFTAVAGVVKTGLTAIIGIISAHPIIAAITAVVAAVTVLYNKCEWFRNAVDNILKAIVEGFKNAADWVKNAMSGLGDFFGNLGQKALNWGRDLISNFVGGIRQKWEDAKHAISDFAGMIKSFLGFSEPTEGPLSNFHTYAPDMMKLFAQGIRDNEKVVADQLARSFDFGPRLGDMAAGGTATSGGGAEFTTPLTGSRPIDITFVIDGAARWVYRANQAEAQRVGIQLG